MKVRDLISGTFAYCIETPPPWWPPQLDIHKSQNFKGYTSLLGENTDPENRGDLHEGFDLGWEDPGTGAVRSSEEDGPMAGENVWPDDSLLPGFRQAALEY
jgi:isopenicillin N synthase-like dioxygenase